MSENYELQLITPSFDSSLTDLILELDHLRKRRLEGTTMPHFFFQLKRIFHTLESVGSARIEGNNTTVAEYIETKIGNEKNFSPNILEIKNVEGAMNFIDEVSKEYPINKTFINQIHQKVVENLSPSDEGDRTPGEYRKSNVKINNAKHTPPDFIRVEEYMNELFEFINSETPAKYDLLKTAIAHHRFVWIHPYTNGNGRTVRLFTYAMLVKQGFNLAQGRIINPTAIFCSDRDKYYENLSKADTGNVKNILHWCEYVLSGLKNEIEKIDKLLDYNYLKKEILIPAINYSLERKSITDVETKILKKSLDCKNHLIQAADIKEIFPDVTPQSISRYIKNLITKGMLKSPNNSPRKYFIKFNNNFLLRGVMKSLVENGFLSEKL